MSNYQYPSNYPPYKQRPQGGQQMQAHQCPTGYRDGLYRGSAYAPGRGPPGQAGYDGLHMHQYAAYGQPPPPPPPPPRPPPQAPQYMPYSSFFPGDHRDIRDINTRDLRDIDLDQVLSALHRPQPPPPQGNPPPPSNQQAQTPSQAPVHTSDGYTAQSSAMSASAMVAQHQYWRGEAVAPPGAGPVTRGVPTVQQAQAPGPPGPAPDLSRAIGPEPTQFNEDEVCTAAAAAAASTFDRFDHDNVGYLDLQEFMDALRALHLSITYHDAIEAFFRADINRDGRVSREEFVTIYVYEMRRASPYYT